ncbi:MAG: hypothetical protein RR405_00060 [Clostridia bacterium]
MKTKLSIRTVTLNNDYHELFEDDSKVFDNELYNKVCDYAYNETIGSKVSLFTVKDGTNIYFGGWLNITDYARRNAVDRKYEQTVRDGENGVRSCIAFYTTVDELSKVVNEAEIYIDEKLLMTLWKKYVSDEIWNAPTGDVATASPVEIDILEVKIGYYKPYYERLYNMGKDIKSFGVGCINQGFSILNLAINNLIRWNVDKYGLIVYVPSGISKFYDRKEIMYLSENESLGRIALRIKAYCSKKGYDIEWSAIREIAEASRYNFQTAVEIVELIVLHAKGARINIEICMRIMDKLRIGYDGLTAEDYAALKLIGAGKSQQQIIELLEIDDIRYYNQILSFLLAGNYIKSNGKNLTLARRGKDVLSSSAIREFIEDDDIGKIQKNIQTSIDAEKNSKHEKLADKEPTSLDVLEVKQTFPPQAEEKNEVDKQSKASEQKSVTEDSVLETPKASDGNENATALEANEQNSVTEDSVLETPKASDGNKNATALEASDENEKITALEASEQNSVTDDSVLETSKASDENEKITALKEENSLSKKVEEDANK